MSHWQARWEAYEYVDSRLFLQRTSTYAEGFEFDRGGDIVEFDHAVYALRLLGDRQLADARRSLEKMQAKMPMKTESGQVDGYPM